MSNGETFFTVIGCMDGRCQEAVTSFGKRKFHADYPDTITEAGIVGILANGATDSFLRRLKNKIKISLEKHHSKGIIVDGHEECAGNPVDDETHRHQVEKSVHVIYNLIHGKIPVVGVFVRRTQDSPEWVVDEVFELKAIDFAGETPAQK